MPLNLVFKRITLNILLKVELITLLAKVTGIARNFKNNKKIK